MTGGARAITVEATLVGSRRRHIYEGEEPAHVQDPRPSGPASAPSGVASRTEIPGLTERLT